MLSGYLIYRDEKYGDLQYSVVARDSFNDLKMQLTVDDSADSVYEHVLRRIDLYDITEDGIVPDVYKLLSEKEKYNRRLDIKKTNKYKTTITNRVFATRISALVRYMQIAGKQFYNQNAEVEFSATRIVDISEPKSKKKIGTIAYNMGIITAIDCENKYCALHLHTVPDDFVGDSVFKELKEKDKFGKKLYNTPISIVGFKLSEELLGFPYVPEVAKEIPQGFGMYQTIEEVIQAHPEKNTAWLLEQDYHIVNDENLEDVIKLFNDWDAPVAFDTETSGLNINFKSRTNEADQLVGCVLSRKPGEGYYFPLQHKLFPNLCGGDHFYFMDRYMRPILEKKKIICHNLKFDWKVAHIYDINVNCFYDTMLAFGVTKRYEDESFELSLKALTKNIFGRDSFELDDFVMGGSFGDSGIAFWDLPFELVRQYAPADTDNTYSLYEFIEQEQILQKYEAEKVFAMEVTFAKAVAYSEFYGYHINVDKIPELQNKIVGEMNRCKKEMFAIAGKEFNPNSPQQLADIMYNQLHVEQVGEKQSTDKETLKTLASRTDVDGNPKYPFVNLIKTYRDNESIYKNFLKRLPEFATSDGYIFPEVLQIGTNTGRVSVKNPNYQGYNDIVKHYVVPRNDYIHFDSDFAQIEQRVLTSYSCIMFPDETPLALLKDFDDPDMDYHQYQAARMFNVPYAAVTKNMRQQSKGINFGLPYGMGDSSLGTRIFGERNAENTKKAADLRKKFFAGQELIAQFFEKVRTEGVQNGYTSTQWGRRRYYHKGVFSVAEIRRQAGNHVIQGCISGDTLINTKEKGIVRIKDVVGKHLHVWDGEKWSSGDITYSGKKQKCVVHLLGGVDITCSPIHKFLVVSTKGNKRFVECKDLATKEMRGKNPHRVVINQKYQPSNFVYNSRGAYKYATKAYNSNNFFLEDIRNRFNIGLLLGRVASDGSLTINKNGGGRLTHLIAEHEYNILPKMRECCANFKYTEEHKGVREGRTQEIARINIYSTSLVKEILELDVKHQIHNNIFMDTEVLRGFLSGYFDGDGGIVINSTFKNKGTICLIFGSQYDFEPMCRDIQKALLFFGVRSYYRRYSDRHIVQIRMHDNQKFLDTIGFINSEKQNKGKKLENTEDEHIFGPALQVQSVEITDEYIDMYDVCNTDGGYYVADGVITHNTAADIYKTAVNNMFNTICEEGWLGKVLINGFIHDEMLIEVHKSINPYYFFKVWRKEFEVHPANYCRLYAGAGVGYCWYDAKKLDLPPLYIQEIIDKYDENMEWNENFDEFLDDIKKNFKLHKIRRVKDYITAPDSQGQIIKPAISSLLGEDLDNVLDEIKSDETWINRMNEVLVDNTLTVNGKNKIKGLQNQLKAFCLYYDIDYDSIDIKAAEDVQQIQDTSGLGPNDYLADDEISLDYNPEVLLKASLTAQGVFIDEITRTIHLVEMYINQNKQYSLKATKLFIDKHLVVPGDKGYTIKYYPTMNLDDDNAIQIPGYCVPYENGSVIKLFYQQYINNRYGVFIQG